MKRIALLVLVPVLLIFPVESSFAKSSKWMSYAQLKSFASKLKSSGQAMDRLECSADMKTGKRYFKVRHKNSKKQWKWAVARSVLNLNKKYRSQGFKQVSLSTVIRKTGKFQCGVWVK